MGRWGDTIPRSLRVDPPHFKGHRPTWVYPLWLSDLYSSRWPSQRPMGARPIIPIGQTAWYQGVAGPELRSGALGPRPLYPGLYPVPSTQYRGESQLRTLRRGRTASMLEVSAWAGPASVGSVGAARLDSFPWKDTRPGVSFLFLLRHLPPNSSRFRLNHSPCHSGSRFHPVESHEPL